MVRKVIRPSGRSWVMIRYRQVPDAPEPAAPLAGMDSPATSSWHGRRIKLEDLADFKAKYGAAVKVGTVPPWRLEYDREIIKRLDGFSPDLCVLAGYMLVVGPELCTRYDMINLHPAAPDGPKGTWQEVIWHLIDTGARTNGVMMHLVTPELDRGPVVAYCTFSIRGGAFEGLWQEAERYPAGTPESETARKELFDAIRRHGLAREFPLITATIKAFSEGKIKITPDKRVVDTAGREIAGYDLTAEIDRRVDV